MLKTISPHRVGLLSFGLITTIWLTSLGFKGIILGLDMVYESPRQRSIWVSRILAFVLTFAVGFLMLLGVTLTLVGPYVTSLLGRVVQVQSMWPYLHWILSAVLIFAAIELLYIVAPSMPVSERITVPGAILATVAWLALAWGLGIYLHYFGQLKFERLYGLLATPIALMVWLYWSSCAILFGAEINSTLQHSPYSSRWAVAQTSRTHRRTDRLAS